MYKYVIKRLLLCLLVLFGVSVLLYLLVRMMPLDYIDSKMQSQLSQGTVSQEDVDNMKRLYGLNVEYPIDGAGNVLDAEGMISPLENFFTVFKSYISGYWSWLSNIFRGNLGVSFKFGEKVEKVISDNMMISFALSGVALIFQFLLGIPLGIISAAKQYSAIDYTVTVFVLMGISLPTFFLGILMLSVFSKTLDWFPYQGLHSANKELTDKWDILLDEAWHMVLPILTLIILSIGGLMRYTRTNMLEVLNADYVRTARAKGCSERSVIYRHAFRNTLIPIVTMLAGILPGLFSGAMITEQVFSIPGIGKRAYDALTIGDVPFIMGYNMFLAILSVIGTLLSDLAYALVDPRVKITK
jgi:peptide/nickel transport system permease protein